MRLFLQAIGLALIVIGLLSVLFWGISPVGIAFPIGATLVWITRKKPQKTASMDGVAPSFPRSHSVMPSTYPASSYSGRSSGSTRSSSTSTSTTRRDDSYVDPVPYAAYSSYDSSSSSSSDCSSSSSYDSGSSSSYDSGSSSCSSD
ncbi:hypothetical protein D3C87_733070 [compost metagenome]